MTTKEFYCEISGNYNEALSRLISDELVHKFALKFLKDPSFEQLAAGLDENKVEESFRAAHTLKGVCKNLSFTKLAESSSEITEYLRSGDIESAKEYFPRVATDYEITISALKKL